ncbi:MAG: hypothetical protein ACREOC_06180 [Gemmatimonadales bacterium]
MDLALSGFALGLLFGAAKVLLIGTVGFGIAWWRGRRRLRELEALHAQPSLTDERLERLEQGLDYLATQLDRVVQSQGELVHLIGGGDRRLGELPSGNPVTPH